MKREENWFTNSPTVMLSEAKHLPPSPTGNQILHCAQDDRRPRQWFSRGLGLVALGLLLLICAACAPPRANESLLPPETPLKPGAGAASSTVARPPAPATPLPTLSPAMAVPLPTATPLPTSLPAARAYLRPAFETVTSATPVMVEVVLEEVRDLYGVQVSLRFDPKVLQVQDMDPELTGVQLRAGNSFPKTASFVALNRADNEQGTMDFAVTLLNPAQPLQGRALVAIFPLIAVGEGSTTLEWETVLLADRNANPLRVVSEPLILSAKP